MSRVFRKRRRESVEISPYAQRDRFIAANASEATGFRFHCYLSIRNRKSLTNARPFPVKTNPIVIVSARFGT